MTRALTGAMALMALAGVASADIAGGDLTVVGHYSFGQPVEGNQAEASAWYSNINGFTGQGFANGGAALQGTNTITRLVMDDITPVGGGTVNFIRFTVANFNTAAVSVRARIRFWDDAAGLPGTQNPAGFSFNPINFAPGVTILTGTLGNALTIPNAKFWAGITFDNNSGGTGATLAQMNNIGQGLFNPPAIGSSGDVAFLTTAAGSFFIVNNPAGSTFNFGGTPPANFGWEFVPAPGSLALLGLGGLFASRRRR